MHREAAAAAVGRGKRHPNPEGPGARYGNQGCALAVKTSERPAFLRNLPVADAMARQARDLLSISRPIDLLHGSAGFAGIHLPDHGTGSLANQEASLSCGGLVLVLGDTGASSGLSACGRYRSRRSLHLCSAGGSVRRHRVGSRGAKLAHSHSALSAAHWRGIGGRGAGLGDRPRYFLLHDASAFPSMPSRSLDRTA